MYVGIDKTRLEDYKETKKKLMSVIKPSNEQIKKETDFSKSLIKKAKELSGKHIDVILAGSSARGTNLKETKDFDIFVLYPKDLDKEQFTREALDLGQRFFKGYFSEKVYSEHPYLKGIIDGYKIDLVPAYKIESTDNLISSVDRTPFHLDFLLKNLKESQKDDIRLLKHFLKHIGCYGADPEFQGFSGYLVELLVLYYGDFIKTIEKVGNWQTPVRIVLNASDIDYLKPFNDPFVVIDPVDKTRNVASAVSLTQLSRFIAASRAFLQNPTTSFFSNNLKPQTYHQLVTWVNNVSLVAIEFEVKGMLKDIVWSKLRKVKTRLDNYLTLQKFSILKSNIYYEEKEDFAYIYLMLDTLVLPRLEKVIGPNVSDMTNSQKFMDNSKVLYGPYIKEDRWYAIKTRKYTDIKDIIHEYFEKNNELHSLVFVEQEIIKLYTKNTKTLEYFTNFFANKEIFL